MRNVIFPIFFNNYDHWPWLDLEDTGLGLGLEHAVLEPIPVKQNIPLLVRL